MEYDQKRNYLRKHFTVTASDSKYTTCNICDMKISCGLDNPKLQSTSGLLSRLKIRYP